MNVLATVGAVLLSILLISTGIVLFVLGTILAPILSVIATIVVVAWIIREELLSNKKPPL